MTIKKLSFYCLTILLGGCIPVMSLHSLFTEEQEQVVVEDKLMGVWVDDPNDPETIWEFSRAEVPENAYKLTFTNRDGNKGSFIVHLVNLDDRLFLDAYPSELPWEPEDPNKVQLLFNTLFMVPVHTFAVLESIEPRLKMRTCNDDDIEKLLKANPKAVRHTVIEDRVLLTASTKELQSFALKYADDRNVFAGDIVLQRPKPKGAKGPTHHDTR
jgi:hypothetical protein